MTKKRIQVLLIGLVSLPLAWACDAECAANTAGVATASARAVSPEGQLRIGDFHLGSAISIWE